MKLLDVSDLTREGMKRVRLMAVLAMAVMVRTGADVLAAVETDGISEQDMVVTMPIYISSVPVALLCGVTFGRWTTRREREHDELALKAERLEKLLHDSLNEKRTPRDLLP